MGGARSSTQTSISTLFSSCRVSAITAFGTLVRTPDVTVTLTNDLPGNVGFRPVQAIQPIHTGVIARVRRSQITYARPCWAYVACNNCRLSRRCRNAFV